MSASQQMVAARNAVESALVDLEPGAHALVAVSGGPDSLALAAVAKWVGERAGLRIGAVIVDHALQHDSHEVAATAAAQCRDLGLDPVIVRRVSVGTEGGPEMAARTARHAALLEIAAEESASCVLLGHTREDQAETVLLRLARGSGARSLSAMAPVAGLLRRPFLGLPRVHVQDLCAELGLTPWTDPHNADPAYARVRVRTALTVLDEALGVGVVAGLARSAELLRDDADALDEWAAREYVELMAIAADGLDLDAETLSALPRAVRTRVIKRAAEQCGSAELEATHIGEVNRLLTHWHGQGSLNLPGRVSVTRRYGRLEIRIDPGSARG